MAAWLALVVLVPGTQASRPAGQPSGQAQKPPQPVSDAAAIAARAMELQKQGKLEEAAAEYRRLLDLAPKSWEARSNLGVVYAQLGEYAEAVSEYHRALALRPAPQAVSAIRYNLAVALYKAGRMRDAAGELEATLEGSKAG